MVRVLSPSKDVTNVSISLTFCPHYHPGSGLCHCQQCILTALCHFIPASTRPRFPFPMSIHSSHSSQNVLSKTEIGSCYNTTPLPGAPPSAPTLWLKSKTLGMTSKGLHSRSPDDLNNLVRFPFCHQHTKASRNAIPPPRTPLSLLLGGFCPTFKDHPK